MAPSPKPQTIYKYPLNMVENQTLMLPRGAEILKVALSKTVEPDIWLWAKIYPDNPETLAVEVKIVGTGHPIPDNAGGYFDTIFYPRALGAADFVFHLFFKETDL